MVQTQTMHQMHHLIPMLDTTHNQSVAETTLQMVELWALEQTIIDKVQQPINHKQPAVETELTIKMLSLVQPNNKSEARLRENQPETLLAQPVESKTDHLNQTAPQTLKVLLQSGTTF